MKSVYSAVRTGSLNKAVCASSLEGYYLYNYYYPLDVLSLVSCVEILRHEYYGCISKIFLVDWQP